LGIPPLIYDVSTSGHRERDANVIAAVVSGTVLLDAPAGSVRRLIRHCGPVLWQTADYQPLWFTLVAMLRSLRGHKTIAICYRNNNAADGKFFRRTIRKILFFAWNALPFSMALTTCPAAVERHSAKFLFDIEWWDLKAAPLPAVPLSPFAKPGRTLVFLGGLSHLKGIDFFIDCAVAAAKRKLEWQFVLVGSIGDLIPEQRERLSAAGATLVPGPKQDAAFISYLGAADLVWCCYHPIYDQSSGVFGRALQLNKATIVREGSLLQTCQHEYGQGLAVAYGDVDGVLDQLGQPIARRDRSVEIAHMHDEATRKLRAVCT
jgi:glycosyltransferase involved in cell wall biosynthesis